jgi:hypothetical protein
MMKLFETGLGSSCHVTIAVARKLIRYLLTEEDGPGSGGSIEETVIGAVVQRR